MKTVEQLAFVLGKAYPNLVRWTDYWVAHPVDSKTLEQIGPAWIPEWLSNSPPKPTDEDLERLWEIYGKEAVVNELEKKVRNKRNALLIEADESIRKLEDMGALHNLSSMRSYRQALRDVPSQSGFPDKIDWPVLSKTV